MNLLIKHGTLVDSEQVRNADLLIVDGLISRIADQINEHDYADELRVIDAKGKYLLPGLIDAHTHYHLVSRGTVTADSSAEGSRLAAFGGVTTIIDFADHDKSTTLLHAAEERTQTLLDGMAIDFALHQGVYGMHEGIPKELEELKQAGIRTIKIFTTYKDEGYIIEHAGLRDLFTACRDLELMVTVHAEDNDLIEELLEAHGDRPFTPDTHPDLRPAEAEARAVRSVGSLAGELGMPIYIVHLSSAAGLKEVQSLRVKGVLVSAETTPHYLMLTRELLDGEDASLYIMTPPLRTADDNAALWQGIASGAIRIVATDHCSFTHAQKLESNDSRTIFPGIPGTEEMLPIIHTFGVKRGLITLQQMAGLLSVNPAKTFGIYPQKGSLQVGTDADIMIFDDEASWTITNESEHTAAGYTPFNGTEVQGKCVMTIRRGEILVEDGVYTADPGPGRFIRAGIPGVYKRHVH